MIVLDTSVISAFAEIGRFPLLKEILSFEKYLFKLHDGEAGVIALAKEHTWIAALDDLEARKIAKKEQVKITGTLGLLKIGYELCPITDKHELRKIINELAGVGFFMAPDIKEGILDTKKKPKGREG